MHRRQFVRLGAGVGGISSVLGGATIDTATGKPGGSLVRQVQQGGTFNVILPGTDEENILEHHYRSDHRPLDMDSGVGGEARSRPDSGGIRTDIELTDDDVYGSAGFTTELRSIEEISEIRFRTEGNPIRIGVLLGIEFTDGDIGKWEAISGNRERRVGFGGDDRALSGPLSNPDSPIARSDPVFDIPGGGPAGERSNTSISQLEEDFEPEVVRVSAFIDGAAGESRETIVQTLDVFENE